MTSRADQFKAMQDHLHGLEYTFICYARAEQRNDEEGMRLRACDYLVHIEAIQRLYQSLYGHLKLHGYVIEVMHADGREPGWTPIVIHAPSLHWAFCPPGQEPTVVPSRLVADWLAIQLGVDLRLRARTRRRSARACRSDNPLHRPA
jgi:hypothetical protein